MNQPPEKPEPTQADETQRLFLEARTHPEEERDEWLKKECGADHRRYLDVQSLLEFDARSFLDDSVTDFLGEGRRIGPYEILKVLASGGTSVVFEARQTSPSRHIALKVLSIALPTKVAMRRFTYEAETLARLTHPGIAQVFSSGVHQESTGPPLPYLAMELVNQAKDVVQYCRDHDLSMKSKLRLMLEVCEAVNHGHLHGFIHRDLKPSNILVGQDGRARIIDFGIAKEFKAQTVHDQETSLGVRVGTVPYMSPEQCQLDSSELDIRTDVYALGLTLYEMLCGKRPYQVPTSDLIAASKVIVSQPPHSPSSIEPTLKGDLEIILLKSLEKNRNDRYQSCAELAHDLSAFLEKRPIQASQTSFSAVLGKKTDSKKPLRRSWVLCRGGVAGPWKRWDIDRMVSGETRTGKGILRGSSRHGGFEISKWDGFNSEKRHGKSTQGGEFCRSGASRLVEHGRSRSRTRSSGQHHVVSPFRIGPSQYLTRSAANGGQLLPTSS